MCAQNEHENQGHDNDRGLCRDLGNKRQQWLQGSLEKVLPPTQPSLFSPPILPPLPFRSGRPSGMLSSLCTASKCRKISPFASLLTICGIGLITVERRMTASPSTSQIPGGLWDTTASFPS